MRSTLMLACALAVLLRAQARAADADKDKKGDAPKEAPKDAPKEQTFTGRLVTNVVNLGTTESRPVATLKFRNEQNEERRLPLFATGDLAKEIKDLSKQRDVTVEVTGKLAPDGSRLDVTKIKQVQEKKR